LALDPERELHSALDDLEALLKSPELSQVLTAKGVNTSLALLAVGGLRNYLEGKKEEATEDFETVSEEIAERMKHSSKAPDGRSKPS
jgi:hypothetical protein